MLGVTDSLVKFASFLLKIRMQSFAFSKEVYRLFIATLLLQIQQKC